MNPQYRQIPELTGKPSASIGSFPKRTPIKRSTKPVRKKRPGKARRVSVVRDRKYLDWLKTQFCVVSQSLFLRGLTEYVYAKPVIIDPAHGPVNGMGSKGGDDGAIPLTREYHTEQHAIGWPAFEEKYGIDRTAIADERYQRYKQEQSK